MTLSITLLLPKGSTLSLEKLSVLSVTVSHLRQVKLQRDKSVTFRQLKSVDKKISDLMCCYSCSSSMIGAYRRSFLPCGSITLSLQSFIPYLFATPASTESHLNGLQKRWVVRVANLQSILTLVQYKTKQRREQKARLKTTLRKAIHSILPPTSSNTQSYSTSYWRL